jgi:hypothetical protein
MKATRYLITGLIVACVARLASGEQSDPGSTPATEVLDSNATSKVPAAAEVKTNARYDEMLGKMQAAVEEIAQLYGNPIFLQVFTNDAVRASELKERLQAYRQAEEIRIEIENLRKKRDDLLSDIALNEKQATKLNERLVRQRSALDSLAAAVDQARRMVEETTK